LPLHPGAARVGHHRLLIFPERRKGGGVKSSQDRMVSRTAVA
jgi:hypothetical protein